MIGPALLTYLVVITYPVIFSIILGFTKYNLFKPEETAFVGFANYVRMFNDPIFWRAFKNNMIVVAVSLFGQIPFGFILAYLLHRRIVRWQNFFQAMVFIPITISAIVVGVLWRNIFSPFGVGTQLLKIVSGNPDAMFTWSTNPNTAMIPIGIVLIWMYTGFFMVVFLANLQRLDPGIVEAAAIDGASELQIFTRVVVPSLSGVILVNAILAIAGSMRSFNLIWAMTQGGPANFTTVLAIYMYKYAFATHNVDAYSFGSAIAITIVVICVVLILIARFVRSRLSPTED